MAAMACTHGNGRRRILTCCGRCRIEEMWLGDVRGRADLLVSAEHLREVNIGEAIDDPGKLADELVQSERYDHDGHRDRHGLQQGSKNLHEIYDIITEAPPRRFVEASLGDFPANSYCSRRRIVALRGLTWPASADSAPLLCADRPQAVQETHPYGTVQESSAVIPSYGNAGSPTLELGYKVSDVERLSVTQGVAQHDR